MRKLNKIVFQSLLISFMFTCLLGSVSAKEEVKSDEEYVGKIITLEEYEGDIEITNSAGRALKLRDNSKLYNGYSVTTEDSYAWISLDKNGIIKLDYDTSVIVKKKGKELEIVLENGSLMFNISESFAEDESLKIKSSTMTTGIRGTLGIATSETLVDLTTYFSLILLEGKVDLQYIETDAKYQELAGQLEAGYRFDLVSKEAEIKDDESDEVQATEEIESRLTKLVTDDIKGYVAIEIKNNKDIQERLESSGFSEDEMIEIMDHALDKLLEDEKILDEARIEKDEMVSKNEAILDDLANPKEEVVKTPLPSVAPSPDVIESKPQDTSDEVNSYKITYKVDSMVFATQSVDQDTVIEKPTLMPSVSGIWMNGDSLYDFTQPVTSDLTLTWTDTSGSEYD